MLRTLLCIIFVVIFLIFMLPVSLITWIIGKSNPALKDKLNMIFIRSAFKIILFLAGTKLTVIGEDRIPKDQSVLYVGNHRGFFDIVTIYSRVFRPMGFVAKIELSKIPLLNMQMKNIHCAFLDRDDLKQGLQTILSCIQEVKNGISICIFPEGTRNTGEEGTILPFHIGSLKIADKAKCPIVPIAITNTQAVFEAHLPAIKSAHVILEYCDPIDTASMTKEEKKELKSRLETTILEKLKEHKSMI